MIKEKLAALVDDAVGRARTAGQIDFDGVLPAQVETPRDPAHGDLSCALSLQLAALPALRDKGASALAQSIAGHLKAGPDCYLAAVSVRDGFINFKLGWPALAEVLIEIISKQNFYGFPTAHKSDSAGQSRSAANSFLNSIGPSFSVPDADIYQTYLFCLNVLRQAQEPRINILSGQLEAPLFSPQQWRNFLCEIKEGPAIFLDLFSDSGERAVDLILKLDAFPEEVMAAADINESPRLRRYTRALAQDLRLYCSRFNLGEGLFCSQLSVLKARLGLIFATKQVLGNALGIIDLSAPERI